VSRRWRLLAASALLATIAAGAFANPADAARATVTESISVDGSPLSLSIPGGQDARITFAGTAGQKLGLGVTGVSGASRYMEVLKPDGQTLADTAASPNASLNLPLSASGTYTISLASSSNASTATRTSPKTVRVR
jgi:large repetitive protein